MRWSLIALVLVGCGDSGELAALKLSLANEQESIVDTQSKQLDRTDEAVVILKDNTAALARIEKQLEASLVESKSVRKEDDQQSAPNPPAKANDTQAPLKVATPGDSSRIASDGTVLKWNIEGNWNPTILETSAHLAAEHGIDTNGMTHQEMADIHAALHDGKPVAMKSKPVQYVTRSAYQSGCPGGVCPVPQRVGRRGRR